MLKLILFISKKYFNTLIYGGFILCLPSLVVAEFNQSVESALKLGENTQYGQLHIDLRYRYEYVYLQDTPTHSAHANTLRLRLGYLTPEVYHLQSYIEYEGNLAMQEDYNSLYNGLSGYEVVRDPQAQELNQFFLSYQGIPNTLIKGGRQRLILDNARFIGNAGWRQMENTYDALLITNRSLERITFNFAYIGGVKKASRYQAFTLPLLNMSYQFGRFSTITGYAYWMTDDNHHLNSTQTYGTRLYGMPQLNNNISLFYDVGYSHQASYANNPARYGLDRFNILLGATYKGVTLKSGLEQLNGNGSYAFQTPLATHNNFQGWADQFLITPKNGVRDIQASIDKSFHDIQLMFVYHNFTDSKGEGCFGNEYDFLVTKKLGTHYQLLAKYAFYDANSTLAANNAGVDKDTHKLWLQGSVSF